MWDATHPYAEVVTENIKAAMEQMDIPYLRLKRETDEKQNMDTTLFGTNEECLKALEQTEGNILLTTGSKELGIYCTSENVKNRLYVRILPGMESLQQCMQHGISGKQILALQGPFSTQLNAAILRQYDINTWLQRKAEKPVDLTQKRKRHSNAERRCLSLTGKRWITEKISGRYVENSNVSAKKR